MATEPSPLHAGLQQPDPVIAYQDLYDLLGTMYWEASDVDSKDLIFGVREEIAEIIDTLDQEDFQKDDQTLAALMPKINNANVALKKIKAEVAEITKNISTAADVVAAIGKVVSLFPL